MEFKIDSYKPDLKFIRQTVKKSLTIYNGFGPHYTKCIQVPNQKRLQNQIKMRTYKTKNTCKKVSASV
jgi:hypothetical protein